MVYTCNFNDFDVNEKDAKKFLMLGIKGDLQFEVLNTKTSQFQLLNKGQIQEICIKHPNRAMINLIEGQYDQGEPCINYAFTHNQQINYSDLWFDQPKFEAIFFAKSNKSFDEELLESERSSLYKMVLGMATSKYGYKPEENRNSATGGNNNSIKADLEKKGLNLDEDTIRGHLQKAYEVYKNKLKF